ncbi:hypothetical protein SASPL_157239 [Salvia splendens]|uniref:Uncharacterized protein n=1 Tax=Salvia splendens TaxID=180675 RepID=A0A8X8YVD5_SALSN|nr:hypothetical protein SASPL_157239 [Salvia splendens]
MKTDLQKLTFIILKPFILFIILSLSIFAFLSIQATTRRPPPAPDSTALPSDLKIRPGYSSYDSYLQRSSTKPSTPSSATSGPPRLGPQASISNSPMFSITRSTRGNSSARSSALWRAAACVLHVLLSRRADKYSANDLFSVKPLEEMFKKSELIEVRSIDGFGLDTEVVFRKIRN